jgi:transcriptional regulator with XRE-family HTH domain
MKEKNKPIDILSIRQKLGLSQQQFWARLGVTQSGGSRYENGRRMPRPVQQLVRLVYVERIDIQKIKREDFEVIEYLRSSKPALLEGLKKEAKAAATAAQKIAKKGR